MNFKVFVEATIYEPIIMLTPLKHFKIPFSILIETQIEIKIRI